MLWLAAEEVVGRKSFPNSIYYYSNFSAVEENLNRIPVCAIILLSTGESHTVFGY